MLICAIIYLLTNASCSVAGNCMYVCMQVISAGTHDGHPPLAPTFASGQPSDEPSCCQSATLLLHLVAAEC